MKVAKEVIVSRRERLAKLLEGQRYLSLSTVCTSLKISPATARRDLRALARDEQITRTYGGALAKFDQNNASFFLRRNVDAAAKEQIALKARKLIHPEMTCFFDSGTTVFALAEAFQRDPVFPVRLVTNNLPVADTLGRFDALEVNLIGGRFLHRQSIMLGEEAEAAARRWEFDLVFLGAEGIDSQGVWASGPELASFQKTVIGQAKRVIICAHASKIGIKTENLVTTWNNKLQICTDAEKSVLKASGLPCK